MSETWIAFDTEFIEDGRTIDLLSIGLVRADGGTYYAEPAGTDRSRANEWVAANVLPNLTGPIKPREQIAAEIIQFAGPSPQFWAYYADYDWVALCQLYGRMIDLPDGWPMYCHDLKQVADERGWKLSQKDSNHNALGDALWVAKHVADAVLRVLAEHGDTQQVREKIVRAMPPDATRHKVDRVMAVVAPIVAARDAAVERADEAHQRERAVDARWQERWRDECDRAERAEADLAAARQQLEQVREVLNGLPSRYTVGPSNFLRVLDLWQSDLRAILDAPARPAGHDESGQ